MNEPVRSHRHLALRYHAFGQPREQLQMEEVTASGHAGSLTVAMSLVPVNPSDLIPICGAFPHRIVLPAVAGYEGVGRVVAAPPDHAALIGERVLPLRGAGTWQEFVDCDPLLAIPVPDGISDDVAARAYINPLAALTMLDMWPVKGKRVLLCGDGSSCADYLGHWARLGGAEEVAGIYRSRSRVARLQSLHIDPIWGGDMPAILEAAGKANLVFDSLGGPIASAVLDDMKEGSIFVGYGLLTGQAVTLSRPPRALQAISPPRRPC
jgi:NADPH:quinone reductase-like Zn-dependent oxidoreductase